MKPETALFAPAFPVYRRKVPPEAGVLYQSPWPIMNLSTDGKPSRMCRGRCVHNVTIITERMSAVFLCPCKCLQIDPVLIKSVCTLGCTISSSNGYFSYMASSRSPFCRVLFSDPCLDGDPSGHFKNLFQKMIQLVRHRKGNPAPRPLAATVPDGSQGSG